MSCLLKVKKREQQIIGSWMRQLSWTNLNKGLVNIFCISKKYYYIIRNHFIFLLNPFWILLMVLLLFSVVHYFIHYLSGIHSLFSGMLFLYHFIFLLFIYLSIFILLKSSLESSWDFYYNIFLSSFYFHSHSYYLSFIEWDLFVFQEVINLLFFFSNIIILF